MAIFAVGHIPRLRSRDECNLISAPRCESRVFWVCRLLFSDGGLMLDTTWIQQATATGIIRDFRHDEEGLRVNVEPQSGICSEALHRLIPKRCTTLNSPGGLGVVKPHEPQSRGPLTLSRALLRAWPDSDLPFKESGYRPACEHRTSDDQRHPGGRRW